MEGYKHALCPWQQNIQLPRIYYPLTSHPQPMQKTFTQSCWTQNIDTILYITMYSLHLELLGLSVENKLQINSSTLPNMDALREQIPDTRNSNCYDAHK